MCSNPEEYKKFQIKEYTYWKIELHGNQCYLGRCIVMLKRHIEDLFEISPDERDELFQIVPLLKESLNKSFNPDMLNYTSLGNEVQHLHLHVIPRYKTTRQFADADFNDKRWGSNPSPYDKNFKVTDDVYNEIVKTISLNLENRL